MSARSVHFSDIAFLFSFRIIQAKFVSHQQVECSDSPLSRLITIRLTTKASDTAHVCIYVCMYVYMCVYA